MSRDIWVKRCDCGKIIDKKKNKTGLCRECWFKENWKKKKNNKAYIVGVFRSSEVLEVVSNDRRRD